MFVCFVSTRLKLTFAFPCLPQLDRLQPSWNSDRNCVLRWNRSTLDAGRRASWSVGESRLLSSVPSLDETRFEAKTSTVTLTDTLFRFSPTSASQTRHSGAIFCLKFNPTGSLLATAGSDGSVCVWEADSARLRQAYEFHLDCTLDVDWLDDDTLASCSMGESPFRRVEPRFRRLLPSLPDVFSSGSSLLRQDYYHLPRGLFNTLQDVPRSHRRGQPSRLVACSSLFLRRQAIVLVFRIRILSFGFFILGRKGPRLVFGRRDGQDLGS